MLAVRVLSPQNVSWKGEAQAVTAINKLGPFSILLDHANFITTIKDTVTIIPASGASYSFEVGLGVLFCRNNQVEIFIQLPIDAQEQRAWWQSLRSSKEN
ncbi:MAG: hypothetical protein HYR90_00035 [Candidatus Andersenbacteria bacterium]|nr:hypothetical protein [Candidatus Andersenbacteria bacterium]MBI3250795.1 hypothetical protein [Candidatus Andersenbacteria bacterium]